MLATSTKRSAMRRPHTVGCATWSTMWRNVRLTRGPDRVPGLGHAMPPPRDGVAAHDEDAAPGELDARPRSGVVAQVEAPGRAEADRGDVGLPAVRVVAVAMPAD